MKHVFPGLAIICATALFIAGSTWPGVVFASMGFLGAAFGAAIRYQQEVESAKIAKELTEAIAAGGGEGSELKQVIADLMNMFVSGPADPIDPTGGGNHGGNGTMH